MIQVSYYQRVIGLLGNIWEGDLVALTGIEPVLSALRGQRVNQLHHSATRGFLYHSLQAISTNSKCLPMMGEAARGSNGADANQQSRFSFSRKV